MMDVSISNEAPKTIEEIGDRTFKVKERMWSWNTVANLPYIWCKDMLNGEGKHKESKYYYPMAFLEELKQIELRKAQLTKEKGENLEADIKSLDVKIAEFKAKQCAECVEKAMFRLDKLHDTATGDCLCLASGPSVLDNGKVGADGKTLEFTLLPKAEKALKMYNGHIVVADRSLIPCLKAGIIPKYVLVADGVDHVVDYIKHELVEKAIKEHGIIGIFNTQTHPIVTKQWVEYGGKIMWYSVALDALHQTKSLSRYLFHMTNDTIVSVPWGNVGMYQYGLSYLIGYNPIILYGYDFGFAEHDKIEDTPYWNPYYKATSVEFICREMGISLADLAKLDKNDAKFKKACEKYFYDDAHEYKSTSKIHPEVREATIKNHFHFYTNPFGNKVYHDNIFKAYKDIALSFFVSNPQAQVINCSDYTSLFADTCELCKGNKKVNREVEESKECYKCHAKNVKKSKGEMIDCWRCRKIAGKNEKGEYTFESTGIQANNIKCMELQDYINSKLKV